MKFEDKLRTLSALAATLIILVSGAPFGPGRGAAEAADAAAVSNYPKQDGPLGYGIFEKIRYKHSVNDPQVNLRNPYLAGAELLFTWSSVEPEEGRFKWDEIDRFMAPWSNAGKKIILGVRTVQKRGMNPTASSATPNWVFDSGAVRISTDAFTGGRRKSGISESRGRIRKQSGKGPGGTPDGGENRVNWPVYWDPVYLDKYERFVKAMAGKYDGHPGIEFIEIGLGQFGSTKIAGPSKVLNLYKDRGYTEAVWVETMEKIIEMYRSAFKKTPLAVVVSPFHKVSDQSGGEYLKTISRYAAERGIVLYNHALTGNDKFVRDNPFPELFHSVAGQTKTALGPDNPLSGNENRNNRKYGNIREAVENAFGGVRGLPVTHIDYLLFYVDDVTASDPENRTYDAEYEEAMRYAVMRLIPESDLEKEGF